MSELVSLYRMGRNWYAEYRDGNMTNRGPTRFPVSWSRGDVLRAIERSSPGIQIHDAARKD